MGGRQRAKGGVVENILLSIEKQATHPPNINNTDFPFSIALFPTSYRVVLERS